MSNTRIQAAAEGLSTPDREISPLERMQGMASAWMNATPQARAHALAASQASSMEEVPTSMESATDRPANVDPLMELIRRYREQQAIFNATDIGDDTHFDAVADSTVNPLWRQIKDACPSATTMGGAIEAVRLAREELQGGYGGIEHALLDAAVSAFDNQEPTKTKRTVSRLIEAHCSAAQRHEDAETAYRSALKAMNDDLAASPALIVTSIGPMRFDDFREHAADVYGNDTPVVFQEARRDRISSAYTSKASDGSIRMVRQEDLDEINRVYRADLDAFDAVASELLKRPASIAFDAANLVSDDTMVAEAKAWDALVSAPCQSPAEVSEKIAYVLSCKDWQREFEGLRDDAPDLGTFLRSLVPGRAEGPTSFAAAYAAFQSEADVYNAREADEPFQPIEERFFALVGTPPRMETAKDAATALRHVIESGAIGDTFDEKLIHGALAFLEG